MLGCYRQGEAADPDIYSAAIAATLARFPLEVAQRVTDPRSGLPARSKWLPTVAEVREACDGEMATENRAAARQRRLAETEALLVESRAREANGGPRETMQELKARLGERFGLSKWLELEEPPTPSNCAMQRANRRALEVVGTDFSKPVPVSPMLVAAIAEQDARRKAMPPERK